jgi:DNA-binding GntR family transcriptional regulator
MTIRRAMKELRERGLIRSVHGKGTFVQQLEAPADQGQDRVSLYSSSYSNPVSHHHPPPDRIYHLSRARRR